MNEFVITIPSFIDNYEIKVNNVLYLSGTTYDSDGDSEFEEFIVQLPQTDKYWYVKKFDTNKIILEEL